MKKFLAWCGSLTLAGFGIFVMASPAQAQADHTFTGSVIGSPDNDPGSTPECDTWARDTFVRTTMLTDNDDGTFDVHQEISGTWVDVINPDIRGNITGFIEYTITGMVSASASEIVDDVDLSGIACKDNSSVQDKSGKWALRYFDEGATAGIITNWQYTYDTTCEEPFVEEDGTEPMGPEVFTKICSDPSPSPSVSPEPDCIDVNAATIEGLMSIEGIDEILAQAIVEIRPISSVQQIDDIPQIGSVRITSIVENMCSLSDNDGGGGTDDKGGLPVTGLPVYALGAAGLVTLGGGVGLYLLGRRRNSEFISGS